jgi:hypothetical protein
MTAKILDFNQYRARKDARFAAQRADSWNCALLGLT